MSEGHAGIFQQPQFGKQHDVQKEQHAPHLNALSADILPEAAGPAIRRTAPYAESACRRSLKRSLTSCRSSSTPSTKAEIGDHDENISYEQSIAHLEKYF